MKKDLDLTTLEPSKFSSIGFLGDDIRPMERIIEDDLAALRNEGLTQSFIAGALQKIHEMARASMGGDVICGPGLVATHYDSRGQLPCPFGDGLFEKGETVLTDRSGDQKSVLSSLSIHLIRAHGFFQGRGSRYRIEPADAVRIAKEMIGCL